MFCKSMVSGTGSSMIMGWEGGAIPVPVHIPKPNQQGFESLQAHPPQSWLVNSLPVCWYLTLLASLDRRKSDGRGLGEQRNFLSGIFRDVLLYVMFYFIKEIFKQGKICFLKGGSQRITLWRRFEEISMFQVLTHLHLIVPMSRQTSSPRSCLSTCQRSAAMGTQGLAVCGERYLSRGSCLVQGWQEVISGQGQKTWKSSCWPDSQGAWLSPSSVLTLWGLQALTVPPGTLSPSSLKGGRESATNIL